MIIADGHVEHREVPIDHPVKTSFGTMTARHAVSVVLTDTDGRRGIGESWINFPAWAPWERVAALEKVVLPCLPGRNCDDVPTFVQQMYGAFAGPAVQSGTVGPLLGVICAIELALWDLQARERGVPLCELWFDEPTKDVAIYASGINAPLPFDLIDGMLEHGVGLFKLKIGFGEQTDRENLAAMKRHLGDRARLAVDVNRKWTFDEAAAWQAALADHDVQWLEEPLRPNEEHRLAELREHAQVPLAGGENTLFLPGESVEPIARLPLDVFQPDVTKYCPPHQALALREALAGREARLVPHILGSAPGQAASLHLAAGCGGLVEWDINRNPLRTEMLTPAFAIADGRIRIPDAPGLGWALHS